MKFAGVAVVVTLPVPSSAADLGNAAEATKRALVRESMDSRNVRVSLVVLVEFVMERVEKHEVYNECSGPQNFRV